MPSRRSPDELSLFREHPQDEGSVQVPSWRPTPADAWSTATPSSRAVRAHTRDLLCRGLEFLQGVEQAVESAGDERIQRFRLRHEELVRLLVHWPEAEADEEATEKAARSVTEILDELSGLRRAMLGDLEPRLRRRALDVEARVGRDERHRERLRGMAEFLEEAARGRLVALRMEDHGGE